MHKSVNWYLHLAMFRYGTHMLKFWFRDPATYSFYWYLLLFKKRKKILRIFQPMDFSTFSHVFTFFGSLWNGALHCKWWFCSSGCLLLSNSIFIIFWSDFTSFTAKEILANFVTQCCDCLMGQIHACDWLRALAGIQKNK